MLKKKECEREECEERAECRGSERKKQQDRRASVWCNVCDVCVCVCSS